MRLRKRHFTVGEMTVPLVACSFLNSLIGLSDTWIAGGISADAQAAVAIGEQFLFITICVATGLSVSVATMMSQAIGARRISLARAYGRDGVVLAAMCGLVALCVGAVFADRVFVALGVPAQVACLGGRYLYMCAFGNLPFCLLLMFAAMLRSFGRPVQALLMTALCCVLSVGGAFVGTRVFPQMAIEMLGLSWLIGSVVATMLGCLFLCRCLRAAALRDDLPRWQERWRRLLWLALPSAAGEVIYGLATLLFFRQILQSPGGVAAQAGYAACAKIEETFATMPMQAVSQATACVVGRKVGSTEYGAATKVARTAAIGSALAMAAIGTSIALLAPNLSYVFSSCTDTQRAMASFLYFSPVLFALLGITLCSGGALEGAGRCARAAMIYSGSAAFVRLPVAAILCWIGVNAIPLTIAALLSSRGLAALLMAKDLTVAGRKQPIRPQLLPDHTKTPF
jgi:Na+-driven multidrug efflux pump